MLQVEIGTNSWLLVPRLRPVGEVCHWRLQALPSIV